MKFEKFSGTDDPGKRVDVNVGVDHVLTSQSSRKDARGTSSVASLKESISQLTAELGSYTSRVGQIEVRLAQLNRTVQGKHLPELEYRNLCKEQATLKGEHLSIRERCADLKVRIASLTADMRLAKSKEVKVDRLDLTNHLLKRILKEIIGLREQIGEKSYARKTKEGTEAQFQAPQGTTSGASVGWSRE